jgi:D-alanine--poly(phosphoribitol) ligase subunit 1
MANLWNAFATVADAQPDAPALVFGDRETTFAELKRLAEAFSATLASRGIGSGQVVALQLPKRVETYGLLLGCLRLGAPYVFVDPKNPADRTNRIVERIRPALLFTTGRS